LAQSTNIQHFQPSPVIRRPSKTL